ncbi:MAG: prepilin-type N-terminal cleavage/methylation domain-containing protein [Deltaproteobacteria bacterium]|nr:prepilin-type N-terminal cleavage/methylation domain-containing protein [Deltaproteobacteria bacterium]
MFKVLLKGSPGFTFLEVMIALAILSGVVVTIIVVLNQHLSRVGDTKDIVIATVLGREKLEDIRLTGMPEATEGDFGPGFEGYTWKIETRDTDIEDIKKARVTVSWSGREVSLLTYVKGL